MKKLYIIRHGKSSWDAIVDDIDRPLTERGVRNSYEMAHRLAEINAVPDLILSSPANRALHTAIIMARSWELPEESIRISYDLYLPETEDVQRVLMYVPDEVESVAIYGHNPAFTDFANMYLSEKVENIPTAGIVLITFKAGSWRDIQSAHVEAEYFDYPKRKR